MLDKGYSGTDGDRALNGEYGFATTKLTGILLLLRAVDEKLDFSDLLNRAGSAEQERDDALGAILRLRNERHTTR